MSKPQLTAIYCCLFFFAVHFSSKSQTLAPLVYSPTNGVSSMLTKGDTLIVGGPFNSIGKYTGGGAMLSTTSDQPDLTFPKLIGSVRCSTPDGNGGFYVFGNYYHENEDASAQRYRIEHILANNTFEPGFSLSVSYGIGIGELFYHNGILYIGCIYGGVSVAGQPIDMLAAWSLQQNAFLSWVPNIVRDDYWSSVNRIIQHNNVLYILGRFQTVGDSTRNSAAAIEIGTGNVKAWNPTHNWEYFGWYNDLLVYQNKIIIGGRFGDEYQEREHSCAIVDTNTGQNPTYLFNATDIFEDDDWSQPYHMSPTRLVLKDNILLTFSSDGYYPRIIALDLTKVNISTPPYKSGVLWVKQLNIYAEAHSMKLSGNSLFVSGLAFEHIYKTNLTEHLPENIERKVREAIKINITDGSLENWFPDPVTSSGINVYTIEVLGNNLFLGGDFSHLNGLKRDAVYMMNTKTQEILPFSINLPMGLVRDMALIGNNLYLAGDLRFSFEEQYPILSYNVNTGALNNWHPALIGESYAMEVNDKSIFIAGDVHRKYANIESYGLYAIDRVSGNILDWAPRVNYGVESLRLWDNKLYVGGPLRHVNGQSRSYIAAFNLPDLSLSNWVASPDTNVNVIYGKNGVIWAGGAYKRLNGDQSKLLAGFDPASGAKRFDSGITLARQGVFELASKGCKLFIGGYFEAHGISNCNSLSVYNLDDNTFVPNDNFCIKLNAMGGQSISAMQFVGNDLYFGGYFTKINNKATNSHLSRLRFPPDYFTPCQIKDCNQTLRLTSTSDDITDGTLTQKTNQAIMANNKIMGSSKVLMQSNKSILLLPGTDGNTGFTAKPSTNGSFKAEISACN